VSAKRVLLLLSALALLGLIGVCVIAAILIPRYVEREVIAAAKERGLELAPGEIGFGWGWVQISDGKAKLIGVRGVELGFAIADVTLDGKVPLEFSLADVSLEAVGNPMAIADDLAAWSRTYEKRTTEPVSITGLSVALRSERGADPLFSLARAKLLVKPGRLSLDAEKVNVQGRELGATRLLRDPEKIAIAATLGQSPLDNPLIALELREAERTLVHAALRPVTVGELGKALGVGLPRPEIGVSGTLDLTVPRKLLGSDRLAGRTDFTLKGYVPPHPIELDGFVFGDTTTVGAAFKLEPERLRVAISDARVKAGRFELAGEGELRAEGRSARLVLVLRGELPCSALAGVVAETRLGRALGKVSGKAARVMVGGGVGVRVSVDMSSEKPEQARVLKTITPGCGLRPLSFEELVKLGELAPEALTPEVMADLKKLIEEGLPPPPPNSALPNLQIPGLGKLELPLLPGFELRKPSSPSGGKSSTQKPSRAGAGGNQSR
jgi:hypothetical protein